MGSIKEILKKPQVKALPFKFKLFLFRYFMGASNPSSLEENQGKKYLSIYLPPFPSDAFDAFLDAQVAASRGDPVPEIVNIAVTTRCKNSCWHCNTKGQEGEIPIQLLKKTIRTLESMGTYQFLLTGGDPLERKDLEEIVSASGSRSIVLISTPGVLTSSRARSLKKAGCQGVLTALEHADEEENDKRMGCKGAYKRSLASIKHVRETGMLSGVWSVFTSDRISSIESFMRFCVEKGVTDVAIFEPMAPGKLLKPEERKVLIDIQKRSRKQRGFPRVISGPFMDSPQFMGCTAGYNRLYIAPDGNIRPCEMLDETWGNIKEQEIQDIWKSMNSKYKDPICGCLALDDVEEKRPAFYRNLIR